MKKKKFLGEGIEYKVYEYGSDFVIKKPKHLISIIFTYISWHPELLKTPFILFKKSKETRDLRDKSLMYIEKININRNLFGNFKIVEKNTIIQDKVIELEKLLNDNSQKSRKYIKKYILTLFELWKYGCSDLHFNLTLNNGVNSKDEVIFLDLGEFETRKSRIKNLILNKSWIENYSYLDHMNEQTRDIFKEEMEKNITLKNLDTFWKMNLKN